MAQRAAQIDDAVAARERMVARQIASRGVGNPRVLDAMREVPREAFVEPGFEEFAYDDTPLPIASGISPVGIRSVCSSIATLARARRGFPPAGRISSVWRWSPNPCY